MNVRDELVARTGLTIDELQDAIEEANKSEDELQLRIQDWLVSTSLDVFKDADTESLLEEAQEALDEATAVIARLRGHLRSFSEKRRSKERLDWVKGYGTRQ